MRLSRIMIYPIKSLDGVVVKTSRITEGGILQFDRVYALVDEAGAYVNAKRTPHIQLLRTTFDPDFHEVEIGENGSTNRTNRDSIRAHDTLLRELGGAMDRWARVFLGSAPPVLQSRSGARCRRSNVRRCGA